MIQKNRSASMFTAHDLTPTKCISFIIWLLAAEIQIVNTAVQFGVELALFYKVGNKNIFNELFDLVYGFFISFYLTS
ncbi:MAG: hypothetical protein EZS28_012611 [Streblomastix strix]|uniref:Uncharacterized protein n=1 Tax=Streblomastix strix TaxID=222440 RepID=A0A5J4WB26_9EUKA|nr:MAG: hypothetical protein EZS28_012611 [Streblomastix strix]